MKRGLAHTPTLTRVSCVKTAIANVKKKSAKEAYCIANPSARLHPLTRLEAAS